MSNISKPETDGWIGKRQDNTFENYQRAEYNKAIHYCERKRTAIDLGGNVGMMAYRMCKDFDEVHSFEPLFAKHIKENTKEFSNIDVYPFAVGDKKDKVTMRKGIYHSGGSNIVKEKNASQQSYIDNIDVVTVDSYNFKNVDFIKIDVEYYELQAITGAYKTIKKYKPTLLVELHDNNDDRKKILNILVDDLKYVPEQAGELDWIFRK